MLQQCCFVPCDSDTVAPCRAVYVWYVGHVCRVHWRHLSTRSGHETAANPLSVRNYEYTT